MEGSIVEWRRVLSPTGSRAIATEFVVRVSGEHEPDEYADTSDGSFGRVNIYWTDGGDDR